MRAFFVICTILFALSCTRLAVAQTAIFHVAADGNDACSGTKATHEGAGDAGPFRTLARARDAGIRHGLGGSHRPGVAHVHDTRLERHHEEHREAREDVQPNGRHEPGPVSLDVALRDRPGLREQLLEREPEP